MNKYNSADFRANPEKYKLFNTAEIAVNFPTINVKIGDVVAIKWHDNKPNQFKNEPLEPVYEVHGFTHYVYASALKNFLL